MNLRSWVAMLALLAGAHSHAAARATVEDAVPPAAAESSAAQPHCPPPSVIPTPDEIRLAMQGATDSGLLWKASKDGRDVWLYGTIHVAQRSWMFPGPHVMQAARASDTIALELNPGDPDIAERLRRAITRTPDSPTLPEPLQRRLLAQMAAACVAPESLAMMRPEMQAVTLEVMSGRQFGLYADYGIDVFLAGMFHGLHKSLLSLETPESQAQLLVSDDPAETARAVGGLLDELEAGDKGPKTLQRLAEDWHRGDLDDLSAYASWCGCMDTERQRADFAKVVDERNPPMADKIEQWHAQGKRLFVAVGSLHMIGPAGLPALLKARGFEVERVAFDR